MSLRTKPTIGNGKNNLNSDFYSKNHKVIEYLQNSSRCLSNQSKISPIDIQRATKQAENLFFTNDSTMNSNNNNNNNNNQEEIQSQYHVPCCSDNDSLSLSGTDVLSRSDFSLISSLSDPGGYSSAFSSIMSSSGICSTFSDIGHEELTPASSEDFEFNHGFDRYDIDIDDTDEINEEVRCENRTQITKENRIKTKEDVGMTLVSNDSTNLDERINELEELLRKSTTTTFTNDIDDLGINNRFKKIQHDSTFTLCSQEPFCSRKQNEEDENEQTNTLIGMRSNSLEIVQPNRKPTLLDKTPKKVVRFADMMGLDLESIRYMTPPDQSANSLIQECLRLKIEQLRLAKSQSTLLSSSPCTFDTLSSINNNKSTSMSFLSTFTTPKKQYHLVSKHFTTPTNIIPLIYERVIMLECLYTKDSIAYGTVCVHNIAYEKHVFVRITENEWQTFQDIQTWHSMHYSNINTDTFTFEIRLKKYDNQTKVPKRIYFAVCLKANNKEFWDNNGGWNYVLDVHER